MWKRTALLSAAVLAVSAALVTPAAADAPPAVSTGTSPGTSTGDIVFSDGNLFLWHADGSGVRQLTFAGDANNPAWSPDGRAVAYDHGGDIWVLRLGSRPRRVTSDGRSFDPAWSPDGSRLAYSRAVRLYLRDIFVVPAAGGSPTRVSWAARSGCTDAQPAWAPSPTLFYVRGSATATCVEGIYAQRLGQQARLVVADPYASRPHVSADGTHLFFLAPCNPSDCNGEEGWRTTVTGADRRATTPGRYLCAEGDLCLANLVDAPGGGWVGAGTWSDPDTGFFETCFQGGHFVHDAVVDSPPQFCLSRPAYEFDIRAA